MRQKIQNILNKDSNIFMAYILLAFSIYMPIFFMKNYGDDLSEIIYSWHLRTAPNLFSFWNFNSEYYKSWSLSYSVLYLLKYFFGANLIPFKIFNIFIHTVNSFLFFKLLRKFKASKNLSILFGLLLLIHPLAIETLIASFQIKTTLSIFFTLSSILFLKDKRYLLSFLLFAASLLSKSTFILLPIAAVFFWKKLNKIFILATLSLSFFLGVHHLRGSSPNPRTLYLKSEYQNQINYEHFIKDKNIEINSTPLEITDKTLLKSLKATFNNIFDYKKLSLKLSLFSHSYVQFFLKAFGFSSYWPIYAYPETGSWSLNISLFITFFTLIALLFMKKARLEYLSFMLTFIPISGIIYVTNIIFSPLSDHWYLPCLFPFFFLLRKTNNFIKLFVPVVLILFIQNIYTQYKYSDLNQLFKDNLERVPKSIILREFLAQNNLKNPQIAKKYFDEILELDPYNENTLIQGSLFFQMHGFNQYPLIKNMFILKYHQKDYYYMDKLKAKYPSLLQDPTLKDYL